MASGKRTHAVTIVPLCACLASFYALSSWLPWWIVGPSGCIAVVRLPWHMLCRHTWSCCLVDALPPCVLRAWRMLCHRSSTLADPLPLWSCFSVDGSPPFHASCLLSLGIFGYILSSWCKFSSSGGLCLSGKIRVSSSSVLLLLSVCSIMATVACVFVCTFLQCFYMFCSLCACVSQALFDYFKFCVSIN